MPAEAVSLYAVGDVFSDVEDARAAFRHLAPLLATGDIVFGNCEGVYSDRPAKAPTHKHFMGARRDRGAMLAEVGIDVMTCANNHMGDGGYVGLRDTLELLRGQGIAVTGAGKNLAEALAPAIVERHGKAVAFLGFCSVFPKGYEARPSRPGIAALRVTTSYLDPDENFWEPGIAPVVGTRPMPEDLERFRTAIGTAREAADVVVVAAHWGYSSRLELLDDYEVELAREAVERGADVVVCHHHHSLRAVEFYEGRPIFYGLGALVHHFQDYAVSPVQRAAGEAQFGRLSSFTPAEEEFPLYPFAEDARKTMVAVLDVGGDGEIEAGFVPAQMLADGSTEPLRAGDPRAVAIADYVARITADAGFDTAFERSTRGEWTFVRVRGGSAG